MVGKSPYSSFRNQDLTRRERERLRQIDDNAESSTQQLFTDLDFTGSNLTSLATRNHNNLQSINGGTTGEYYHFTQTEHAGRIYKLTQDTTQTGNVGAGEDDLITYTLSANTLSANGDALQISAFGTTAANGNSKTIKIYLGATELSSAVANTPNDQDWCFEARIIRTGSSSAKSVAKFFSNDSADDSVEYVSLSEDFTTNLTIKCTGEGTSTNDVVQEALIIEFIK